MKLRIHFLILLAVFPLIINAAEFNYGGLRYKTLSSVYQCSVTYLSTSPSSNQYYVRGNVIIPDKVLDYSNRNVTVIEIGQKSFLNCKELISVEIGSKVEVIREYAFEGCSSLSSITVPSNVNFVCPQAFKDCTSLKEVFIDATAQNETFLNCTSLENVVFGETTKYVLHDCFTNCPKLKSISVKKMTPPTTDGDFFRTMSSIYGGSEIDLSRYADVVLYVPLGSRDSYKSDTYWGKFEHIIETDFAGVEEITLDNTDDVQEIYNINGVKLDNKIENLPCGIYILKTSKTSKKIIIK